jgi:hypothetical protein
MGIKDLFDFILRFILSIKDNRRGQRQYAAWNLGGLIRLKERNMEYIVDSHG